jgi:NAD(P)-dependent dehydrogenase (short-subunit alcohol dehydrogenase family)
MGVTAMKVLVVGATGTIGKCVSTLFEEHGHSVTRAGHQNGDYTVDLGSKDSIRALFEGIGQVDAVVSTAGAANFAPLKDLTDVDFQLALNNKLMGQVNLVRVGSENVNDNGSITLTSGLLAREPMPGSAAISMANGGLESFTKAAAQELEPRIRVNVVSPVFVKETMEIMGMDSTNGVSASDTAKAYLAAIQGNNNGDTLDVRDFV